ADVAVLRGVFDPDARVRRSGEHRIARGWHVAARGEAVAPGVPDHVHHTTADGGGVPAVGLRAERLRDGVPVGVTVLALHHVAGGAGGHVLADVRARPPTAAGLPMPRAPEAIAAPDLQRDRDRVIGRIAVVVEIVARDQKADEAAILLSA